MKIIHGAAQRTLSRGDRDRTGVPLAITRGPPAVRITLSITNSAGAGAGWGLGQVQGDVVGMVEKPVAARRPRVVAKHKIGADNLP